MRRIRIESGMVVAEDGAALLCPYFGDCTTDCAAFWRTPAPIADVGTAKIHDGFVAHCSAMSNSPIGELIGEDDATN